MLNFDSAHHQAKFYGESYNPRIMYLSFSQSNFIWVWQCVHVADNNIRRLALKDRGCELNMEFKHEFARKGQDDKMTNL
jgi:hypothetical protein